MPRPTFKKCSDVFIFETSAVIHNMMPDERLLMV